MADLIVDFPQQRRRRLSSTSKSIRDEPPRARAKKGVHFAPEYSVRCYERYAQSDFEHIWYDADDYASFRVNMREAAREVHANVLKMQRPSDTDTETSSCSSASIDDFDMTGIEHLLSPGIIKKTRASRMRCRRAVMDEQDRQERLGVSNHLELASVACEHSAWSVRRARTIGCCNQQPR